MIADNPSDTRPDAAADDKFRIAAPQVSLPKGGGAIRGIGEKFAANPVTGTGSMSVPIPISPGRSGFGPQLSLSYDSGAGNGPSGFGWTLSAPAITRRTDKVLPLYRDTEESDVFILSGAEDLVPVLKVDSHGAPIVGPAGRPEYDELPDRDGYRVRRYRPRVESLFARIERWTSLDGKDSYWRSISSDNVTTIYGGSPNSRIADPDDASRIFSWKISESYDDKGNAIVYVYAEENSDNVDLAAAHERNHERRANRYLKRIKYGNTIPRMVDKDLRAPDRKWLFEVVFDYGEHDRDHPTPDPKPDWKWLCRRDKFSTYRAGFEVRTYRLCQRVLMFHHFAELGAEPCLVRSTDFAYEDDEDSESDPRHGGLVASFLRSLTQTGYKRRKEGSYLRRSMPPLEFRYSPATIDPTVRELDPQSLENLPEGVDGQAYQWVDLEGEGLSGVLTEQADGWFYKRNLSPVSLAEEEGVARVHAALAPLERVATRPNANVAEMRPQFMDLKGDGRLDLVLLDGPTPGFYEHDDAASWQGFRPFTARLNRDLRDPNLRLVDLDGDGCADVLITEDDVLTWHPSLGEKGFGAARHVPKERDEEAGPALVFADGTQSVHLAGMSGDGSSDIVRIRNGSVCYWPNLGYGRFGAKVTMDNAPWFDAPDLFDQRRLRLADIDGSGTTDIIYLHRDGARLYFNQSGNLWSAPQTLAAPAAADRFSAVAAVDVLGIGTTCLVWSSPLPGAARAPMKYVDLMSGRKPHLLVEVTDNLGAVTTIEYAPSTRFYLQDKLAGRPWITRLPFPVQCVARVTVRDSWRQASFSTSYSYHHGYYDRAEREFRGFGRVEQVDCDSYGASSAANATSPYVADKTLFQPPIKTVTWYHTGAFVGRDSILGQFKSEYFVPPGGFREIELAEPDLLAQDLTTDEWREALRACKGMMLRQEVYELDVAALEHGAHLPVKLFSTAYHNCDIRFLQPMGANRHAVFLAVESEAITYRYELDIKSGTTSADPRIAHSLNLRFDDYGRPLQAVVATYPRHGAYSDTVLSADDIDRIAKVQKLHLAYTETRFTDPQPEDPDSHRLPAVCDVRTYELSGFPIGGRAYTLEGLRSYRLSDTLPDQGPNAVAPLDYEQQTGSGPCKRLVERVVTRYFMDDLTGPRALGEASPLGLKYETYKLALTASLLTAVLRDKLDATVRGALGDATSATTFLPSGYLPDSALFGTKAAARQWWMRSGVAGFAPGADQRFYLPERYTDPFGNVTTVAYDGEANIDPNRRYCLFVQSSTDALGNTVSVRAFDYRVLAPARLKDANDNESAVAFDALGRPVATAQMGKVDARPPVTTETGDTLAGFSVDALDPDPADLAAFFAADSFDGRQARLWLGKATTRVVYHFGDRPDALGEWGAEAPGACSIVRERHERDAPNVDTPDPAARIAIQVACAYSDGGGNVLVSKVQAEPAEDTTTLRWIASGKTIVNNKGKPVKQYEPYWSATHRYDAAEAQQDVGAARVMYYDGPGRLVRTDVPDGSFSRVEFSPWFVRSFDQNDTLADGNPWYEARKNLPADDPERRAADLAKRICGGTPAETHLDSLGRDVVAVAHNRTKSIGGAGHDVLSDEWSVTFTKLDAEGKPLWIRDARGNLVMQYIASTKAGVSSAKPTRWADDSTENMPGDAVTAYDIAGNLMYQHSMDADDRWMIMDGAGQPFFAWDQNESSAGNLEHRIYTTRYDDLHRPVSLELSIDGASPLQIEQFVYSDTTGNSDLTAAKKANLIGKLVQHYDASGLRQLIRCDWRGNVEEEQRTLVKAPDAALLDWSTKPALATDTFTQTSQYDALSRLTQHLNWHRQTGPKLAIYQPRYNERGALVSETLTIRDVNSGVEIAADAIREILYNVKGQKEKVTLGNGTVTHYDYDPQTFRLRELRTTRPGYDPPFPSDRASLLADPKVLQQLRYTYDPVGNIAAIEDGAFKPVYFQNTQVDARNQYEYDALYRLTYAAGRETAQGGDAAGGNGVDPPYASGFPITDQTLRQYIQRYGYDAAGNFLTMRHIVPADTRRNWTRTYTPAPDSNRLDATVVGPASPASYRHDTHGNMLNLFRTASGSDASFALRWDHRDMIASLDLGGGGEAFYQYDANKQRTRKYIKRNGSGTEERLYLGGYELYRRYSGGSKLVEEIETHHLFEGDNRVLMVDDVLTSSKPKRTLFRYQYSNHLGSVCLELDDEAPQPAIISYEEYHPYGTSAYRATQSGAEAPPKRYRYTGMERDEESGLNYHNARYYACSIGRWIGVDPRIGTSGESTYCYAPNNAIKLVDRTGAAPLPAEAQALIEDVGQRLAGEETHLDRGSLQGVAIEAQSSGVLRPSDADFYRHQQNVIEEAAGARNQAAVIDRYKGVTEGLSVEAKETLSAASRSLVEAAERAEAVLNAADRLRRDPNFRSRFAGVVFQRGSLISDQLPELSRRQGVPNTIFPNTADFAGLSEAIERAPVRGAAGGGVKLFSAGIFDPEVWSDAAKTAKELGKVGFESGRRAVAKLKDWFRTVSGPASEIAAGIGKLATLYGATNVALNVSQSLQQAGSPFLTSNLYGSTALILAIPAGAVDDAAMLTPFAQIVLDSWKDYGAGPAQRAVGEGLLQLGMLGLRWDRALGLK